MGEKLTAIKGYLSDFFAAEKELARVEIVPSVKKAGVGTGFLGAAVVFALHALWMFVIGLTGLFAWLLSLTGLSMLLSITLGFLITALVTLIIAAIFGLIGVKKIKQVRAPKAAIAEAKATVNAITDSIAGKNHGAFPEHTPGLTVIDEQGSRLGTAARHAEGGARTA